MNTFTKLNANPCAKLTLVRTSVSTVAMAALIASSMPVQAAIDNTATANGTAARGTYTPATDGESVNVAPALRDLTVSKTVSSVSTTAGITGVVDTGDIITYRYVIRNTGSATLTNVGPVDTGPTFNGVGGGNTLSAFAHAPGDSANTTGVVPASVAPGQTVVFTANYTLTQLDYLRGSEVTNGIDNTATAQSLDGGGNPVTLSDPVPPSTVEYDIPGAPNMLITKVAVLTETSGNTTDNLAEVGDSITYSYAVLNTGNVAMTDVAISDDHENGQAGAVILSSLAGPFGTANGQWEVANDSGVTPTLGTNSDDGTDGDFDSVAVGGRVIFTYRHTVTQAEFDAQ